MDRPAGRSNPFFGMRAGGDRESRSSLLAARHHPICVKPGMSGGPRRPPENFVTGVPQSRRLEGTETLRAGAGATPVGSIQSASSGATRITVRDIVRRPHKRQIPIWLFTLEGKLAKVQAGHSPMIYPGRHKHVKPTCANTNGRPAGSSSRARPAPSPLLHSGGSRSSAASPHPSRRLPQPPAAPLSSLEPPRATAPPRPKIPPP